MTPRAGLALMVALAAACAGEQSPPRAEPVSELEPSAGGESPSAAEPSTAPPPTESPSPAETAVPAGPPAPAASSESTLPSEPVVLNGQTLSAPDLSELQAVFGQAPAPGRYWYDPRSGLWGLEQHGAGGVTRTGLRVPAAVPADASGGTSGAFVNDRQLTARELSVMAEVLGWDASRLAALAGRYTLDEKGGLYSSRGRYLGSVSNAAERERARSTSPAPCAWLKLGSPPDVLGRGVTVNCD